MIALADLEEIERAKYQSIWQVPWYRQNSPAERRAPDVIAHLQSVGARNVVDLGAGSGRGALALARAGYQVELVDIASNCLDPEVAAVAPPLIHASIWDPKLPHMVSGADAVTCIDVIEHIPPLHVEQVLTNIEAIAPHGYLAIALFPHVMDGVVLHLTVEPVEWWDQTVRPHFPDAEVSVSGQHCIVRY